MSDTEDWPFFDINGEEHCDEEEALAQLLHGNILFANSRRYLGLDGNAKKATTLLFVNCNDVFAWACADAEPLPYAEIGPLYKAWKADASWGVIKWCCRQRNQRPQPPIEKDMREAGAWDDGMEALPLNTQDAETQAMFAAAMARKDQT